MLSALCDYQSDVVVLLPMTELLNVIDNRREHGLRGRFFVSPQGFDQAIFSEFLSGIVERLGYAVGV